MSDKQTNNSSNNRTGGFGNSSLDNLLLGDDFLESLGTFDTQSLGEGLTQFASESQLLPNTISAAAAGGGGSALGPNLLSSASASAGSVGRKIKKEKSGGESSGVRVKLEQRPTNEPTQRSKRGREDAPQPTSAISSQWACPSCTFLNNGKNKKCEMCGAKKPKITTNSSTVSPQQGVKSEPVVEQEGDVPPPAASARVKPEPIGDAHGGAPADQAGLQPEKVQPRSLSEASRRDNEDGDEVPPPAVAAGLVDDEAMVSEADEEEEEVDAEMEDGAGSEEGDWDPEADSSDDEEEEEDSDDEEGLGINEEHAKEIVEFLQNQACVDPQKLPAVQPPALLQQSCQLKPFQMQGYGWMRGMEEGKFNAKDTAVKQERLSGNSQNLSSQNSQQNASSPRIQNPKPLPTTSSTTTTTTAGGPTPLLGGNSLLANLPNMSRNASSTSSFGGLSDFGSIGGVGTTSSAATLGANSRAFSSAQLLTQAAQQQQNHQRQLTEIQQQQQLLNDPCSITGGILADYMGLGKTRMTVTLCEATRPSAPAKIDRMNLSNGLLIKSNATLIVCPVSLMKQWHLEICTCKAVGTKPSVLFYYGTTKRRKNLFEIAKYDYVITSYNTLAYELITGPEKEAQRALEVARSTTTTSSSTTAGAGGLPFGFQRSAGGHGVSLHNNGNNGQKEMLQRHRKLSNIQFYRIVLDEAHTIRNHGTCFNKAVQMLQGERRWCLTGTPLQNRLSDLQPLFEFLKLPLLGTTGGWREMMAAGSPDKVKERLRAVLQKIMLRRKPTTIVDNKPILVLPKKTLKKSIVELSKDEKKFYDETKRNAGWVIQEALMNTEMHSITRYASVFVMLLRTRQALLHGFLVVKGNRRAREKMDRENQEEEEDGEETKTIPYHLMTDEEKEAVHAEARRRKEEQEKALEEKRRKQIAEQLAKVDKQLSDVLLKLKKGLKKASEEFRETIITKIQEGTLNDDADCVICLCEVDNGAILPCGHSQFCGHCIKQALKAIARCPICKQPCRRDDVMAIPDLSHSGEDKEKAMAEAMAKGDRAADNLKKKQRKSRQSGGLPSEEDEEPNPLMIGAAEKLHDYNQWYTSSKVKTLVEDMDAIVAKDSSDKIIVFSFFVEFLEYLQHHLHRPEYQGKYRAVLYHGQLQLRERTKMVADFAKPVSQGGPRVLLASISTCNVGLNLTMANHAFLMEPTWNPAVEEQAMNRIHRIGQEKDVTVTRYYVEESMDEDIMKLAGEKAELAAHCIDGKAGASSSRLGLNKILALFDLNRPQRRNNNATN